MNYVRKTPASKGQIKCFHCKKTTATKDGGWQDFKNQQVFVCKTCTFKATQQQQPSRHGSPHSTK